MDEWMEALRGGELRATEEGLARIQGEVRRRRRLRRGAAAGAVAGAAVTVVATLVLGADDAGSRAIATDPNGTAAGGVDADVADCLEEAGVGMPPEELYSRWLGDPPGAPLENAMEDVRRRTRGIEGAGTVDASTTENAVIVHWKEPVPAEVRALEDLPLDHGIRVVVVGVPYSAAELARAGDQVMAAFGEDGLAGRLTFLAQCSNGVGVTLGITPRR
ncbi:hypothetical protein [Nocardioides humi]|uniref:hypothetical protein n=1 Tax=Nocardioides humi TaxID=449461 RepID=UPI001126A8D1|nr:hypothetical protein [Nocardioides humi]